MRSVLGVLSFFFQTVYAQSDAEFAAQQFNLCLQSGRNFLDAACPPGTTIQNTIPVFQYQISIPGPAVASYDYSVLFSCVTPGPNGPLGIGTGITCFHSKNIRGTAPASFIDKTINLGRQPRDPVCKSGSIINLETQSWGESFSISGVPLDLHYHSIFDSSRLANRRLQMQSLFAGDYQVPRRIQIFGPKSGVVNIDFPAIGSTGLDYLWSPPEPRSPFVDSDRLTVRTVSPYDTGFTTELTCTAATIGSSIIGSCSTDGRPNLTGESEIQSKEYILASYKPEIFGLGGLTLSNHHYYDSSIQTVFLGYGLTRNIAPIQRVLSPYGTVNLVAAEDASEVYIFDQLGRHMETRTGLIGAIKWQFKYLSDNKLDQIVDSVGNAITFERTSNGEIRGIRSPFGITTSLETNALGKVSKIISSTGAETELFYGPSSLLTRVSYPSGLVTDFQYTDDGIFLREQKNTGGFQGLLLSFENLKRTIGFATAEGVVSDYVQDSVGSQMKRLETGPMQSLIRSTETSQDGNSEIIIEENYRSDRTYANDIRFGAQSQFISQNTERFFSQPLFSFQTNQQNISYLNGEGPFNIDTFSTTQSLPGSATVRQTVFSGLNKSLSYFQNGDLISEIELDSLERTSKVKIPGQLDVAFLYNGQGQIASVSQGVSRSIFGYNSLGHLTSETDAQNRTTLYSRDLEGRVLTKTHPNGEVISFEYNSSGSLKKLVTSSGTEHSFNQSLLDQVTQYIPPSLLTGATNTSYTYDLDGRLKTISKPGRGVATIYYKAGTNFIERITTPDGDYLYEQIDSVGRVGRAVSPDGVVTVSSFVKENVLFQSYASPDGANGFINYTYNELGQVVSINIRDQVGITQTFDSFGRLTRAGEETFEYQAVTTQTASGYQVGRESVVSRLASGITTTSVFESNANPDLVPILRSITARLGGSSGSILVSTTESVDSVNNITLSSFRSEPNLSDYEQISQHLIYDLKGRLLKVEEQSEKSASGVVSGLPRRTVSEYTFLPNSNNNIRSYEHFGKLTTAQHDSQDRLLKLSGAIERDFEYLADGTLSKISNCLGEKRFEYDFFGNLKRVILPNGKTIEYKIDAFNRRVSKSVNGNREESYLWYDQTRIAQAQSSGGQLVTYVYGAHPIAASYAVIQGQAHKIIPSWKGDVRYILNPSGSVLQELQYDEYGNTMKDTSLGRIVNGQAVNTPLQPLGFVSGLTDFDTKMIRFGARDYDPVVGRWTAKDPIGFDGGLANLYSYCGGDPVNCIDPSGLEVYYLQIGGGFSLFGSFNRSSGISESAGVGIAIDSNTGQVLGYLATGSGRTGSGAFVGGGLSGGVSTGNISQFLGTGSQVSVNVGAGLAGAGVCQSSSGNQVGVGFDFIGPGIGAATSSQRTRTTEIFKFQIGPK